MSNASLDKDRLALGVRQPWAELILRGVKTVEIRSTDTRQRGIIYLYASKKFAENPFAEKAIEEHELEADSLPRGVLVGTIDLWETGPAEEDDASPSCVPAEYLEGRFAWRIKNPVRLAEPVVPRFLPYGVWFYPFRRRNASQAE